MIRVLILDMADTLARGDRLFPHVREALDVISRFETSAGDPLDLCLVSDSDMPKSPRDVEGLFDKLISTLEALGLRSYFEPVYTHVTLSAQAGANMPDRRVFEKAVERLGSDARLSECLFVTADKRNIRACHKLGIATLLFNPGGPQEGDFDDWAQAPMMVAQAVAPASLYNKQLVLKLQLATAYDMELLTLEGLSVAGRLRGRARVWRAVTVTAQGRTETIDVAVPVKVEIEMDKKGKVRSVKSDEPDPEALAESAHFIKTLRDQGQIADEHASPSPDQTHKVETDEKGRKRLKRTGFTAI